MNDGNSKKNEGKMTLQLNTFFLYLMTFSNYVLNLATIPYLTRILGPTIYGNVGLAIGYMGYVQIILDFGFILSATQLVSNNRTNIHYLSMLITSVSILKIILFCFLFIVLIILYRISFFDINTAKLLSIYFLSYLCAALLPDYYYRGIENMKIISLRTLVIRIIFTILIFKLVKSKDDVLFVPFSQLVGNIIALIISFFDLYKKYSLHLIRPSFMHIFNLFKKSFSFFISRFAITFYQALNIILIGKFYGFSPVVGYYTSADKIVSLAKMGATPIADSLYPYMLHKKNFILIKQIFFIAIPIITICVFILGIFAEPICIFLFGFEYRSTSKILLFLLPVIWIIFPNYIIAFPVMAPLGLSKYTNLANIVGMIFQLIGIFTLYILNLFNVFTICILTSLTEIIVFLFRVVTLLIFFSKKKQNNVR